MDPFKDALLQCGPFVAGRSVAQFLGRRPYCVRGQQVGAVQALQPSFPMRRSNGEQQLFCVLSLYQRTHALNRNLTKGVLGR